jgi:hypothetical protein
VPVVCNFATDGFPEQFVVRRFHSNVVIRPRTLLITGHRHRCAQALASGAAITELHPHHVRHLPKALSIWRLLFLLEQL